MSMLSLTVEGFMRFLVLFLMMSGATYGTLLVIERFGLEEWDLIILITVGAAISLCHSIGMKFFDRSRSVHDGRKE